MEAFIRFFRLMGGCTVARPKHDPNTPSARERIANAFWNLVIDDSLDNITVLGLSRAAGVSHNTFYYHFTCIESMAEELIAEMSFPDIARLLLAKDWDALPFESAQNGQNADVAKRFTRFCAIARNGSPYLVSKLNETLVDTWLTIAKRDRQNLTHEEEVKLAYMASGIMGALATVHPAEGPADMLCIAQGPIGDAMRKEVAALAS